MTAYLELAGAVMWIVAGIFEIVARRYEHRMMRELVGMVGRKDEVV